jgi:hypothetical protein
MPLGAGPYTVPVRQRRPPGDLPHRVISKRDRPAGQHSAAQAPALPDKSIDLVLNFLGH